MAALVRHKWIITLVTLLLCLAGSKYIPVAIQPNNDIKLWFEENDDNVTQYDNFQKAFGNDRIIIVAFKSDSGILNTACLKKIRQLTMNLEFIDGVNHVTSVLNQKDFRRIKKPDFTTIVFAPWLNENSIDSITQEKRDSMMSSSLIKGKLINAKGDVAQIIIHLDELEKIHQKMPLIVTEIRTACVNFLGADNYHLGGTDIIQFGLNELSQKDFVKFTGLSYLVMFLAIGLLYRRIIYMAMVFVIAFSALWLTLALYGFLGYGLNIFTVMTPPLVIMMSIINPMHIINRLSGTSVEDNDQTKAAAQALKDVLKPCFYATITTIIGFLSLLTSSTSILKEFGWLTAAGCLLAFLLSFTWGAVFLPYVRQRDGYSFQDGVKMRSIVKHLSLNIQSNGKFYTWLSILLSIIGIIGLTFIKVDMHPIGYFPGSHAVVQDHQFMTQHWGKYYPIDMVFETKSPLTIKDVRVIKALMDFDSLLSRQEEINASFSYINVMDRFAQIAYHKDLREILNDPFLVKQFSTRFNKLTANESGHWVTDDFGSAKMTITGTLLSISELEKNLNHIHLESKSIFKETGTLKAAGYPALFMQVMNYAFQSMKSSLFSAFIFVFISMLFLLKNFRLACIALVPNIFPVVMLLGFLGFAQINLDLATCTVAAIALGIAIDDTIHILYRYREEKLNPTRGENIILSMHMNVGAVVILTSVVLFAGFSVLLFASLKTVLYFGLLSMISVAAALYGDLVILTLILKARKDV